MSKRFKISTNFFIITDTDTNVEELRYAKENVEYMDNDGSISFYAKSTGLKKSIKDYIVSNVVNGNDSDNPFANLTALKDYLDTNVGKTSPEVPGLLNGDIFNGGFADYNDSGSSQPITVVASPVVLQNDGAGLYSNKLFLPQGVTDVWDVIGDQFDWSELKTGDMIDIRLDIVMTTVSPNTTIDINLHLGAGGGAYIIPFITKKILKSAGAHNINRFNGIYIGDTNTLDNGGQFKIIVDQDCSAVVNGWYIKIIRKG